MLNDILLEHLTTRDFDKFDFADKPMQQYCEYHRNKHILMVVQLTKQRFAHETAYEWQEVEDFIHGLNHLFFNGVAAGQCLEWSTKKR